jgi:hypothetical protein
VRQAAHKFVPMHRTACSGDWNEPVCSTRPGLGTWSASCSRPLQGRGKQTRRKQVSAYTQDVCMRISLRPVCNLESLGSMRAVAASAQAEAPRSSRRTLGTLRRPPAWLPSSGVLASATGFRCFCLRVGPCNATACEYLQWRFRDLQLFPACWVIRLQRDQSFLHHPSQLQHHATAGHGQVGCGAAAANQLYRVCCCHVNAQRAPTSTGNSAGSCLWRCPPGNAPGPGAVGVRSVDAVKQVKSVSKR